MGNNNCVVTYECLLRRVLWDKLAHTPSNNDKAVYWIGKLYRKFSKAQQDVLPLFNKWLKDMGEKYGERDAKGEIKTDGQWPMVRQDAVEEFKKERDAFMGTTVDLGIHMLPLSYFAHIQKTPIEMETLEQIANITPEALESGAPDFSGMVGPGGLHAVNG
jgi:hypothetical protein